jgi:outer membrane protein assembly factor BamB
MTPTQTVESTPQRPLRLWPGVVVVALQWMLWLVVPRVLPDASIVAALGGVAGGAVVLIWWLFFSRAAWIERLGAIVLMVAAVAATWRVVHQSIRGGMMGMMLVAYAVPALSLALVVAAAVGRRMAAWPRRAAMASAVVVACAVFTLLRTGGVAGSGASDWHWRWTPTPEERLLIQARNEDPLRLVPASPLRSPVAAPVAAPSPPSTPGAPAAQPSAAPPPAPPAAPAPEWPGFRGADRDGVVHGERIETDWTRFPPTRIWRRPVGPGWSSFAVRRNVFYTQEQRGDDEIVSCYELTTGEPVWRHRDAIRFWESNGGAGPRATPTLAGDRVYAMGATGILNALDAAGGAVIWSRNVATDTDTKLPTWGFAASPLVIEDVVVAAASGRLAAYDVATGKPRWVGPAHGGSYSSPHRVTIDGVLQVLMLSDAGATGVAPADGAVLWEHPWPGGGAITQPARITEGDVLVSTLGDTGGVGTRRIAVARGSDGWTATERWTSAGLKPYFNDLVVHKGHAFGFDGSILACIDLADGKRMWKGGRYGNGQLVLLADQDLLLVLSEDGELALVGATPDQFRELARIPALEGKTWNHPVVVGDVLLVRNGEEMAAFRLPRAGR